MSFSSPYWKKIISNLDWNKLFRKLKLDGMEEKRKGEVFFVCPFHDEKEPSFSVNKNKGVYHCFGCGQNGNLITLISSLLNVSKNSSFEILERYAGLSSDDLTIEEVKQRIESLENVLSKMARNKEEIPKITPFPPVTILPRKAIDYLERRNITRKESKERGIKYCDYGYFSERLIIPLYDAKGKYMTFEARLIREPENIREKKVLYSSGSKVNSLIYNFHENLGKKRGVLVEGIMDTLSLTSRRIRNVISCFGTQVSDEQKSLLSENFESLVVLFDSDSSGKKSSLKLLEELSSLVEVKIAKTNSRKDPKYCDIEDINMAIINAKDFTNSDLTNTKRRLQSFLVMA